MHRKLRSSVAGGLAFAQAVTPFATARAGGPSGAQITAGSVSIAGQGTANVIINQSSNNAIINWNMFNLGSGDSVRFIQPNAAASTLNRITGATGPSQILGSIDANGRVFLINPDGFIFGSTARINTGSFLATTHDIRNSDFLAGNYAFNIPGNPRASITNAGTITAATGGFAALVAPAVRNDGIISANLGVVALAGAGKGFVLDLYGDSLIKLYAGDSVPGDVLSSVVNNTGKLSANGGRVEMTAATAQRVVDNVINTSGVVEARSVGLQNGKIVFSAPTSSTKNAGAPTQTVKVSGKVDASGKNANEVGGVVFMTGEAIALQGVVVDASGTLGGGKILVGGDFMGGNPAAPAVAQYGQKFETAAIPTSMTVSVDVTSTLNTSATLNGNGGKLVVWSDQSTSFNGQALSRGGEKGGNGGFIEISAAKQLSFNGTVDARAPFGVWGTALFDPGQLYIVDDSTTEQNFFLHPVVANSTTIDTSSTSAPTDSYIRASRIEQLLTTSSVYLYSAFGNIYINAPITAPATSSKLTITNAANTQQSGSVAADPSLTRNIYINAPIDFSRSLGTLSLLANNYIISSAAGYIVAPNYVVTSNTNPGVVLNAGTGSNDDSGIGQSANPVTIVVGAIPTLTTVSGGGAGFPNGNTLITCTLSPSACGRITYFGYNTLAFAFGRKTTNASGSTIDTLTFQNEIGSRIFVNFTTSAPLSSVAIPMANTGSGGINGNPSSVSGTGNPGGVSNGILNNNAIPYDTKAQQFYLPNGQGQIISDIRNDLIVDDTKKLLEAVGRPISGAIIGELYSFKPFLDNLSAIKAGNTDALVASVAEFSVGTYIGIIGRGVGFLICAESIVCGIVVAVVAITVASKSTTQIQQSLVHEGR